MLTNRPNDAPYVEIVEQPSSKGLRFRYECEGRSAGSINGITSTNESKTYPAIKVVNARSPCVLVVSCVTHDDDKPKPHPHALVGADCNKGVFTKKVRDNLDRIQLKGLGIQCCKKKEVGKALEQRKAIRVDPFRTGFEHASANRSNQLDLNALKLCFQVFLHDERGKYTKIVAPVCSDIIRDKKSATDLVIEEMSICSASCEGGDTLMMLTGKLPKEVQVRFTKSLGTSLAWEKRAKIHRVHHNVAIVLEVPAYQDTYLTKEEEVYIQIGTEREWSERKLFKYLPRDTKATSSARKRKSVSSTGSLKRPRTENPEVPGPVDSMHSGSFHSGDPISGQQMNTYGEHPVVPYPTFNEQIQYTEEQLSQLTAAENSQQNMDDSTPAPQYRQFQQASDANEHEQQGYQQVMPLQPQQQAPLLHDQWLYRSSEDGKVNINVDHQGAMYVAPGPAYNGPIVSQAYPISQANMTDEDLNSISQSAQIPSNLSEQLSEIFRNPAGGSMDIALFADNSFSDIPNC